MTLTPDEQFYIKLSLVTPTDLNPRNGNDHHGHVDGIGARARSGWTVNDWPKDVAIGLVSIMEINISNEYG